MSKLILWDIDGTLLSIGYLGAEVFDRAFVAALGIKPPSRVKMSGKTDPQIVSEYLDMLGFDKSDYPKTIEAVLASLQHELAMASDEIKEAASLKVNAREILEYFAGEEEIIQTVLTGNIIQNAKLKLELFSLLSYFDFDCGAFGSDDIDRTKLVTVAAERVYAKHNIRPEAKNTWIIGDSPNDFACARASGIRCILVATGRFDYDELSLLGADLVCHDLSDQEISDFVTA